jgi:HEAT repeat protein
LYGCGYNLNQALRDVREPTTQKKAVDYLCNYISQTTGKSGELNQRVQAVRALGVAQTPRTINTLRMVLMHEIDSGLRKEAIRSLAQLRAIQALQEIREALGQDKNLDVRMVAAATLGSLGDQTAQRDLLRALKDPQPAVRTAAVRSLVDLRSEEVVPHLVDALLDSDEDVRVAAQNGLLKMKKQSLPRLMRELTFLNRERKTRVAEVLARLGRSVWVPLIRAFAITESHEGATQALIIATQDGATWNLLHKILNQPFSEQGKMFIEQLRGLGSLATIIAVFTLWDRIAVGYRLSFREILGDVAKRIGHEARQELYRTASVGDDLSIRSTAVFALGRTGKDGLPLLRPFLQSPHRVLVISAIRAFGWMGEDGIEDLQRFVRSQDEEIRINAIQALGQLQSPKAVDLLMQNLQDQVATIRIATLQALANQGDRRAIPEVRKLVNDPMNDVMLTAIQTLLQLGDRENLSLYITYIQRSPFPPDPGYVKTLARLGDQRIIPVLEKLALEYVSHWKNYNKKATKLYKQLQQRYRRMKQLPSPKEMIAEVKQQLSEEIAAQAQAVCTFIEAMRGLSRLNYPSQKILSGLSNLSVSQFNPLQTPPASCPWPALKPIAE